MAAQGDKDIIKQFLDQLAGEVKRNIPSASGETAASIEVVVPNQFEGSILGAPYIQTLEDGRGPTRSGAPKGSPTLREKIEAWLNTRAINPDGITTKSLAYIIARKIHAEGNVLFRQGGKSGVLSSVFTNDRIDSFQQTLFNQYEILITSQVLKDYKATA